MGRWGLLTLFEPEAGPSGHFAIGLDVSRHTLPWGLLQLGAQERFYVGCPDASPLLLVSDEISQVSAQSRLETGALYWVDRHFSLG